MLAGLFSAIKSVFGATPTDRADDVERFRARSRLRSRQQRGGRKCASPDPADGEEEEDDDAHRRRKVTRSKAAVRPADKRLLSSAHAYTASTYQSYLAPPAVFDDGLYPDSPVVHEHQVLMMNAFDFAASPEAFLYDDDAALYADGGSGGQQENRSLWRRRFSSAASDTARTPRLSPKLGSDALWASHFADDAAVDKLRAEADAHLHACYCPSETRGLYYD